MKYRIFPPEEIIEDGIIELPLSKSLSTRGLVLDAMTQGGAVGGAYVARCDDTEVIEKALSQVEGTVDVGASGAALRFLTAYFAAKEGVEVELRGTERLHERPMGVLIEALRGCGAEIECIEEEGYAPLRINGRRLRGGEVNVDVTVSSQFVSALLMVAPMMDVSLPYILMTVGMMEQRGIKVDREPLRIKVEKGSYRPFDQQPEGDWSAAAFWYEISALTAGWITVTNLKEKTLQGDKAAMRLFECLGVNTVESEELQGDLTDNPDLAPALAVTCCLIGVPFKLTGLKSLGVKECDRLTALCEEMDKIGRVVEKIRDYGLEWDGKSHPVVEMPEFSSHNDHRIAMALAPVAVYVPGVVIDGCEAVSKSYPDYWRQLQKIGFRIEEVEE